MGNPELANEMFFSSTHLQRCYVRCSDTIQMLRQVAACKTLDQTDKELLEAEIAARCQVQLALFKRLQRALKKQDDA